MTERATVQQVSDRDVTVELRSLAACGGCTACGGIFGPAKPQTLRAGNPRHLSLHAGDLVEVGFAPGKAVGAGFMVLILPLALFIGAFAAAGAMGVTSEPLKVVAGVCALAAGFGIAFLHGRSKSSLPEVVGYARQRDPADAESCCAAGPTLDGTRSA